jgi:hypothetical protein
MQSGASNYEKDHLEDLELWEYVSESKLKKEHFY